MVVYCRRNVADLSPTEQRRFRDAVFRMYELGQYQKYIDFHGFVSNLGHFGPAFLPWHRAFLKRFEEELQAIDSGVSLPYWDFTSANVDGDGNSLIWTDNLFKGRASTPGPAIAGNVELTWEGQDGTTQSWTVVREGFDESAVPVSPASVTQSLGFDTYQAEVTGGILDSRGFRNHLERSSHGAAHNWLGIPGDQASFATAVNDPFFMLLHANIDRIWSIWQQQRKQAWAADPANAGQPYPGDEMAIDYFYDGLTLNTTWPDATAALIGDPPGAPNRHNLDDEMWPWDGTEADPGDSASSFAPWNMPGLALSITPRQMLDTVEQGYVYDTDLPHLTLRTPSVAFNNVPEGETTVRAIVFDALVCGGPATIELIMPPGSDFGAPFGVTDNFVGIPGAEEGELRIWLSYTGTTAGASASGTARIRCNETGETWDVPISAATVPKPTVLTTLVLDRSGSMGLTAGLGDSRRRIDVLRQAASIFIDAMDDDDGIAIASFNHDATPEVSPQIAGPPLFGAGRIAASSAANSLSPGGATSIGDGIEVGQNLLDTSSSFNEEAMVVFTDGYENSPQTISEVSSLLNSRVFAIGLGEASQLNPAALDQITSMSQGSLMMTGDTAVDELRLGKFFLQVLAGVTNNEIAVDPEGFLKPGDLHQIKFQLTNLDSRADVYLILPHRDIISMQLRTPTGSYITPSNVASIPGCRQIVGQHVTYYRLSLPAVLPPTAAHEGTWTAELKVNEKRLGTFQETLQKRDDIPRLRELDLHGVAYRFVVGMRSALKMRVIKRQESREPGASVELLVRLSEMGMPLSGPTRVMAELFQKGEVVERLQFEPEGQGRFRAKLFARDTGTYEVLIRARGQTARGLPFTREHLLTVSTWEGGDAPIPKDKGDLPRPPKGEESTLPQDTPSQVPVLTRREILEALRDARFRLDLSNGLDLSRARIQLDAD